MAPARGDEGPERHDGYVQLQLKRYGMAMSDVSGNRPGGEYAQLHFCVVKVGSRHIFSQCLLGVGRRH